MASNAWKWGLGAVALLGVGVVAAGSAAASDDTDGGKTHDGPGLDGGGVRHGIRYEGCAHFELVDADAVEAWGRDNAWRLAEWAFKLDAVRQDPEPAIIDAMTLLFPECPWPPESSTTFGPQRVGWEQAMAFAREAVAELDLGGESPAKPGRAESGRQVARLLMVGLRGRGLGGQPG